MWIQRRIVSILRDGDFYPSSGAVLGPLVSYMLPKILPVVVLVGQHLVRVMSGQVISPHPPEDIFQTQQSPVPYKKSVRQPLRPLSSLPLPHGPPNGENTRSISFNRRVNVLSLDGIDDEIASSGNQMTILHNINATAIKLAPYPFIAFGDVAGVYSAG
jgi:hypothetical protein